MHRVHSAMCSGEHVGERQRDRDRGTETERQIYIYVYYYNALCEPGSTSQGSPTLELPNQRIRIRQQPTYMSVVVQKSVVFHEFIEARACLLVDGIVEVALLGAQLQACNLRSPNHVQSSFV